MLALSTGTKNVKSMQFCKMKKNSVCLEILYLAIVLGRKAVEKVRQVPLSHGTHVSRGLKRMGNIGRLRRVKKPESNKVK